MDYVKEFKIGGIRCFVQGIADKRLPGLDRLIMTFGPVDVGIWNKDERKALIAALVEADAHLDMTCKEREVEK